MVEHDQNRPSKSADGNDQLRHCLRAPAGCRKDARCLLANRLDPVKGSENVPHSATGSL